MRKGWAAALYAAVWGVACANDEHAGAAHDREAGTCAAGDEGCPCDDDGACGEGLTCASHLCVRLPGSGGAGSGGRPVLAGGATARGTGGATVGAGGTRLADAGSTSRPDAGAPSILDGGSIIGKIVREGGVGETCQGTRSPAAPAPLDLYVMLDQSTSMSCATPSATDRWSAVKAGLSAAFAAPAASTVGVGLQYFGLGSPSGSCNSADYENPDVEIAPLATNANMLLASLKAHQPSSNTPTAVALTGALNHAIDWKAKHFEHTVAVVLVTDGEPNACGAVSDVSSVAASGFTNRIPTYVVGVISTSVACNLDGNPPNATDLDAIAAAGGTRVARLFDTTKSGAQDFAATMAGIENDARQPCVYSLPATASPIDPNRVNLEYTPSGAAKRVIVPRVTSGSSCDAAGGWYYDNDRTPTEAILCPASCTALGASALFVELNCPTVIAP